MPGSDPPGAGSPARSDFPGLHPTALWFLSASLAASIAGILADFNTAHYVGLASAFAAFGGPVHPRRRHRRRPGIPAKSCPCTFEPYSGVARVPNAYGAPGTPVSEVIGKSIRHAPRS